MKNHLLMQQVVLHTLSIQNGKEKQIQRLHTTMAILMQNIKYNAMDRDTELGMLSVIITMIVLYLSIWLFN